MGEKYPSIKASLKNAESVLLDLESSASKESRLVESSSREEAMHIDLTETLNPVDLVWSWVKKALPIAAPVFFLSSTEVAAVELEEIVVTAQKRAESIQDVPIAMQAFTGDELSNLGVSTASDITKLSPNMTISGQNAANRQISIRGVGTNDFFGNATGAVGVYMDEVTMSAPYLSGLGLYDLERVEILRGPQNSLFGRNTTGGAVNYISRMPEVGEGITGYLNGVLGNYDRVELEGAVSFELSDKAAMRIAAKSYNRDGIWNNIGDNGNDWGEKDRQSIRVTLLWQPTHLTDLVFNFHTATEDSEFDPIRAVGTRDAGGVPTLNPGPVPSLLVSGQQLDFGKAYSSFNAQGDNPSTGDWEDVYVSSSNRSDIEANGFFLKLTHEMEWATFNSITSYDETEVKWGFETGGIGLSTHSTVSVIAGDPSAQQTLAIDQDQSYEQLSQELRLTSADDSSFQWVAGLYYFQEDSTLSQNIRFGIAASPVPGLVPPILGGSLGLFGLGGNAVTYSEQMAYSIAEIENTVISPYVHSEFALTDKLNLIVGLRYTYDEKSMPSLMIGNLDTSSYALDTFWDRDLILAQAAGAPLCDLNGLGNIPGVDSQPDNSNLVCSQDIGGPQETQIFEEVGGKVGLDYQLSEKWMVYSSYSRGFRSGKHDIEFLHGPQTGFARKNVDVETLDAFEVGFKSTLFDESMQFNASAFYSIWNDQQLFFVGASGPDFANIDESQLKGLEFELKWAPAEGWLVQAGLGFLDTEVTKSSDEVAAAEGHELPFSPQTSANLLLIKDFNIGDGVLSLQANVQYQDDAKAYATQRDLIDELEGTTKVDVRATYLFGEDERYELVLFGQNITEEESCQYKFDLTAFSGTVYCTPNEKEAFYGIEARVMF